LKSIQNAYPNIFNTNVNIGNGINAPDENNYTMFRHWAARLCWHQWHSKQIYKAI